MAFVNDPIYQLNITVQDWQGHKSTNQYHLRPFMVAGTVMTNFVSVYEACEFIVAALALVIDGEIVSWTVSLRTIQDSLVGVTEGVEVEDKGLFLWSVTGGFRAHSAVPTFKKSYLGPDGIAIDIAEADVSAYIVAITTDIDTGLVPGILDTVKVTDYRAADVISYEEGYLQQRQSSRRGSGRRSG